MGMPKSKMTDAAVNALPFGKRHLPHHNGKPQSRQPPGLHARLQCSVRVIRNPAEGQGTERPRQAGRPGESPFRKPTTRPLEILSA